MRILHIVLLCLAGAIPVLAPPVFAQDREFITVDGASLTARMDEAIRQGQALTAQPRFWTAWAFDVIPGVAVDVETINTDGTMSTFGMMIGGGFETRRLGVFLLREPGNRGIIRIEVFNMDRRRNYSGYPVYWLDHANAEESLAYLASLAESNMSNALTERVIRALALHDEPGVLTVLERIVGTSSQPRIRAAAVSWLGHLGDDPAFFVDLVRREDEILDVRKRAVSAIASRSDRTSLATLRDLYGAVKHHEVKSRLVSAIANSDYDEAAAAFLIEVARNTGEDHEIRKQAIGRLSHVGGDASYRQLITLYDLEQDMELKTRIINAFASTDYPPARQKLLDLAQTADHPQLRRRAVRGFVQRGGDQMIPALIGLYDTESNEEVQNEILNILGESHNPAAMEKLIAVAQNSTSRKLQKKATYWIGKSNAPRAVQFFENMFR